METFNHSERAGPRRIPHRLVMGGWGGAANFIPFQAVLTVTGPHHGSKVSDSSVSPSTVCRSVLTAERQESNGPEAATVGWFYTRAE